ncbi:MAG: hypothetical protein WKF87_07760 [Chryseolinea sp.]
MKRITRLFSLLLMAGIALLYVGCDDDPSKSEEETQLDKLRGTWNIQSVDNDGTSRTDEYPDMTVTISGTFTTGGIYSYTSDATSWPSVSPWKALDSWKFKSSDVLRTITRQSDLVDMTYTLSNSDNTLTIDFVYTGAGFNNARTESVSGDWSFVFTK